MTSQYNARKIVKAREEIQQLARQVFDYDEWHVWITGNGVNLQPTGNQKPLQHWDSVEECLDDLRTRALLRFTPWQGYTEWV